MLLRAIIVKTVFTIEYKNRRFEIIYNGRDTVTISEFIVETREEKTTYYQPETCFDNYKAQHLLNIHVLNEKK